MTTSTVPAAHGQPASAAVVRQRAVRALVLALVALAGLVLLSLALGARSISPAAVLDALVHGGTSFEDVVVRTQRLPRTAAALVAGVGLAVAGALMQAVTRNPLADPGILGVSSGSAFAIAIAAGVLGLTTPQGYLWFGFAGALLAAVAVWLVGAAGPSSTSPARLTLAGVALGAVLSGITSAMLLFDPEGFNAMRSWQSGSLPGRGWEPVAVVAPFVVVGVLVAVLLGPALNAVALGDDRAQAMGVSLGRVQALSVLAVTLLAGGATAVAGPIVFVGLMVPYVARRVVGPDQRWIIALSAVLGPGLLLAADVLGRLVLPDGELPAGVVTAVIGAPVLIVVVRGLRVSGL
ncbi:ABC transporter permease [Marmoricola endophyticus]|uniref:ABC transporter permease n=1 Tax=Marmoricola endophyticus TaxID=2040280 RepID=A0A917F2L4_9ACTN|nr:iron chelate uptake ABC transporter family permease subunit [Marmoricola endophyticus]GGF46782.1 ABC transporter permease [Marmoricola endophyticus]